jgi:6-phosphogluconolactonase (cycloisomerase 2 family)
MRDSPPLLGTVTVNCSTTTFPRFAYIADSGDDSSDRGKTVSIYSVDPSSGQLRPRGYLTADTNPAFVVPVDRSPDDLAVPAFDYVVNDTAGTVSPYKVLKPTGLLQPIGAGAVPSDQSGRSGTPISAVADPTGRFLYVANEGCALNQASFQCTPLSNGVRGSIVTFSINQTTGELSQVGGANYTTLAFPHAMTIAGQGKYLYVSYNDDPGGVSAYSINPTTGVLTELVVQGSPYRVGAQSKSMAVDPAGKFLYVANDYNVGISIFVIDPNSGKLSVVPGGINTEGTTSIAFEPSGRFLYSLESSRDHAFVYAVNSTTGALSRTTGCGGAGVCPTGSNPDSITVDPSGRYAYVGYGQFTATNRYSTSIYKIDPETGTLTAPNTLAPMGRRAPIHIAITRGKSPVNFVPKYALVANSGSDSISSFSIDSASGSLTKIGDKPVNSTAGTTAGSVAADPLGQWVVALAQDRTTTTALDSNVSNLLVGSSGLLSNSSGPLSTFGKGFPLEVMSRAVVADPSGQFVYAINIVSNTVYAYRILNDASRTLSPIGSIATGSNPTSIDVDPSGRFAFVTNRSGNNNSGSVSAYAINAVTGALQHVPGSPFGTGYNAPIALGVHPSGRFLFVANIGSHIVTAHSIDPASGAISSAVGPPVISSLNPLAVAADPTGRFVYVANQGSSSISGYAVNLDSEQGILGALTRIDGSPFQTNGVNFPAGVTADPSGKFLLVVSNSTNNMSVLAIDQLTGALRPALGAINIVSGNAPKAVAITGTVQ